MSSVKDKAAAMAKQEKILSNGSYNREKFQWHVVLMGPDGTTKEVKFACYWDPNQEHSAELVAQSASALHNVLDKDSGKQWAPVSAQRI